MTDTDQPAPKAFISHASEDKDGFVREFATQLRGRGIDAWLDEWEIAAGDSLVRKIFTQGIGEATIFIVVLSKVSVTKPWVLEELDASVVQRIQEGARLIPVVLGDVEVPLPLRHLLWLSEPRLGMQGVIDEIARAVFGQDNRPPLGPTPGFATQAKRLLPNAIDDAVLNAIIDMSLANGEVNISEDDLVAHLKALDIDAQSVEESVGTLATEYIIKVEHSLADYSIHKVAPRVWLDAARARGVDVDTAYQRLLGKIVNEASAEDFDMVDPLTRDAMLEQMEDEGLINMVWTFGGPSVDATFKGKRVAREF